MVRSELKRLRAFVEEWDGHAHSCDCLDEGSPQTSCTCGYETAREKILKGDEDASDH